MVSGVLRRRSWTFALWSWSMAVSPCWQCLAGSTWPPGILRDEGVKGWRGDGIGWTIFVVAWWACDVEYRMGDFWWTVKKSWINWVENDARYHIIGDYAVGEHLDNNPLVNLTQMPMGGGDGNLVAELSKLFKISWSIQSCATGWL